MRKHIHINKFFIFLSTTLSVLLMLLSCISSCFHDEKSSEIEDKANFIFGEESKLSRLSRQGYAELYCKVYDAQTRHPVGGANVTVFDVERYEFYDTLTSPVGLADFSVLYTNGEPDYVIVKKAGYQSEKIEFYVTKPELYMNIYLTPTRMHNVDGTVYLDGLGVPAEVYFLGVDTQSYGVWYDAYCDDYGKYSIEIPEGVYELHANYEGYENVTLIVLKGDRTVDLFLDSNLEWYNFTVKGFVNDTFGHAVDVSKVSLSFTFWDEDGERIFEKYCMYETNETTGEYEYKVELPALSGYVQISAGGYEGYLRKRVVREINSNILWQNISLVRSPESTATLHVVINNLGDETFAILYDLKHEYMFVSSRINSSGEVDWQVYGSEYALVVVDTNNWNVNVSYVSVGDYEEKNVDCILEEYVKVEEYKTDMIFSGWQNVTVCKSAKLTKTESIFERLMLECGGLIGYEIFDKDGVLNRDGMISAEECNLYRNYSRYGSLKEKNQLPQLSVEGISFMLVDGISDISSISLLAWGASNWSIKNYEGEIFSNKRVEINYSYELCTVSNIQPSSSYIYDVRFEPVSDGFYGVKNNTYRIVFPNDKIINYISNLSVCEEESTFYKYNDSEIYFEAGEYEFSQNTYQITLSNDTKKPEIINYTMLTTANNGTILKIYINVTDSESGIGLVFIEYSGNVEGGSGSALMTEIGSGMYMACLGPVYEGNFEYRFVVYDNGFNFNETEFVSVLVVPYIDTIQPVILDFTTLISIGDSETALIYANITDDCAVLNAQLHLYFGGVDRAIQMTKGSGDSWYVRISKLPYSAGTVIYYITANDTSYNNVTSATKSFTMRDSTPPVFIGYMITPSQTYSHSQINLTISIFDSTNVSVNATFMGRDSNVTYMMNRISKPLADGSYNYTVTANPIASRNGSIIIVLEAKDAYGNVAHKTIEIEILSSSEAISTEIVGKTRPGERISIVGKVESAGNYTGLGFELYIEFDNGQKENVELLPDGNYIYNFMIPSDISEGVHLFNLTLKDLFDKQMLKATIGFSYRLPHFNKVQSYDLSVILTIILAAILVGMLYVFKYRAGKSEDKEDRKEGKDNKNDTNKNDSNKE